MMLEYLGWKEASDLIVIALERTLRQGITTADITESFKHSSCVGTKEFGEAVVSMMKAGSRFGIR